MQLHLTLAEVNYILRSLGTMPYADVVGLIPKIQSQAQLQITENSSNQPSPTPPEPTPSGMS